MSSWLSSPHPNPLTRPLTARADVPRVAARVSCLYRGAPASDRGFLSRQAGYDATKVGITNPDPQQGRQFAIAHPAAYALNERVPSCHHHATSRSLLFLRDTATCAPTVRSSCWARGRDSASTRVTSSRRWSSRVLLSIGSASGALRKISNTTKHLHGS